MAALFEATKACLLIVFCSFGLSQSESIIARLLEQSALVDHGDGYHHLRASGTSESGGKNQPQAVTEFIPYNKCRIAHENEQLAERMVLLCHECEDVYERNNFNVNCRANCFDNEVARRCAVAMLRPELLSEFDGFLRESRARERLLTNRDGSDTRRGAADTTSDRDDPADVGGDYFNDMDRSLVV